MAGHQALAFATTVQLQTPLAPRVVWSASAAPTLEVGTIPRQASVGQSIPKQSAPCACSALASLTVAFLSQRRRWCRQQKGTSRRSRGGEANQESFHLPEQDKWIESLDLPAFGKEVQELGQRLKAEQGEADQEHLHKILAWSRICAFLGLASMWLAPNPFTILFLSLWTHSAWTMIGHHVCHGGYNWTDDSGEFRSSSFALGSLLRRATDWFDWMLPEAWNHEHNVLHHFRLGENSDPDLLERNVERWEGPGRYILPVLSMFTWKWSYYAPNTYKELKIAELKRKGEPLPEGFDATEPLTLGDILNGEGSELFSLSDFMSKVAGPYILWRFVVMPLPLVLINPAFYTNAVVNLLIADIVSNIHGFIVIVPNHAGSDLYRFETSCKPRSPTFYLRQITSSANFGTGGDMNDFMHGFLNYQIEHHCWPELSMLSYQKGQPELKAICDKYGVPYVQENVFIRLAKTMSIAWQWSKMRRYPLHLEREEDAIVWNEGRRRPQMATA